MNKDTTRHAMTLVETLITIGMIGIVITSVVPALAAVRGDALNEMSKANLMQLGQARDQYAMDNADQIFSYSWRAGETYTMPDGRTRTANSDQEAAANQNSEILLRRTQRLSGQFKIRTAFNRLPHRRFSHLVILDELAGNDNEVFNNSLLAIDPADQNVLTWHERPLEYGADSGVPYSDGIPNGYEDDFNWVGLENKQRWTFASSYQVVPYAWQGDGPDNVYAPVASTPHLYQSIGTPELGRRLMGDVAFPAQKVHMHEEFDFEQKRYPYFAYDHAIPEKLMFDGSINSQSSGDANSSYSPANPSEEWTQTYIPLDTYPIPLGGLNDPTQLNMRYRWTLNGLQGVDYD